ncbi:family 2 encapsulin nanocompartment cargo protein terpene cyclase [Streptomyces noursei]|nr:family 2 encapsulin nanocompartment cargo protein terpene cyclase [Streptomyces noursei]
MPICLPSGPTGLGTSAARDLPLPSTDHGRSTTAPSSHVGPLADGHGYRTLSTLGQRAAVLPSVPSSPTGGSYTTHITHVQRPFGERQGDAGCEQTTSVRQRQHTLYCPPAIRDDPVLGEEVNERLVAWAEEVGIYPGHLDMVRSANFGRLMMLAHPETDDPDRLLAAAKCGLSEWAVDDHIVDGEVETPRHGLIGQRLALCHSVIDQAQLPVRYAPSLEKAVRHDPVARALRSALTNLHNHATTTQVRRLRHELAIMFVAFNQEGVWHTQQQVPPVWEYLMHRHEISFIPCMVLIDAIAGYEIPMAEFSHPQVRRAFNLAGTATVLVNDLYSMGKEDATDYSLPMLIAREENCSLEEAVDRSVEIHDELMHTFEAEAAVLAATGSPELRRFLAGTWAWAGGNREWHASSARYHTPSSTT